MSGSLIERAQELKSARVFSPEESERVQTVLAQVFSDASDLIDRFGKVPSFALRRGRDPRDLRVWFVETDKPSVEVVLERRLGRGSKKIFITVDGLDETLEISQDNENSSVFGSIIDPDTEVERDDANLQSALDYQEVVERVKAEVQRTSPAPSPNTNP